jgi:hypothetical protein
MKTIRRKIKTIYDFFRLWIHWGDAKEAWQDARFKNNPHFQEQLKEFDKAIKEHFEHLENGVH